MLVAALLVAAATVVVWRPWDPVPDELRAAAREAEAVPGVLAADVDYTVTLRDAKDGDAARAVLTVLLDEDLAPDDARRAAERAAAVLATAEVPSARSLARSTTVHAGEPRTPHGVPVHPVTARVDEDGDATAVADAFRLRRAGAVRVSGASVEAADTTSLVRLARFASARGIPASLATGDGAVRYDGAGTPDLDAVRLVVDAAGRPGVESALFDGSSTPLLQVGMATPVGSPESQAVRRWLDESERATTGHVRYVVTEPGYADRLEGRVGGGRPDGTP